MTEIRAVRFQTDEVSALLDGRKTQFRRPLQPQPVSLINDWPRRPNTRRKPFRVRVPALTTGEAGIGSSSASRLIYPNRFYDSPFGLTGDLLWVQEARATKKELDQVPPRQMTFPLPIWYKAGGNRHTQDAQQGRWRPGHHMPQWASRFTLRVVDIKVSRVKTITTDDIRAEGIIETEDHNKLLATYSA